MLRTIICDDEAPALELMKAMLLDTGSIAVEGAFASAREAVERINAFYAQDFRRFGYEMV